MSGGAGWAQEWEKALSVELHGSLRLSRPSLHGSTSFGLGRGGAVPCAWASSCCCGSLL